ncbi:MAG: hypothetical protein IPJ46_17805 [Anaerolineales bacterium]|nr:hypothetical protein [Anaerolineales bacterium]
MPIQFYLQSGLPNIHDMKLVQELFPRTIVMDEGQVVADGLTQTLNKPNT